MINNPIEISIVVPVYNGAQTINELVGRIQRALKPMNIEYELLLTDDCSTDDSWREISGICQSNKEVIGLRLSENRGQWFSTLAGMSATSGRYVVTIDDDLEYDPDDIVKLYQTIINKRVLVVFGIAESKYLLQGKSLLFYKIVNTFLNIIWNDQPRVSFKIMKRSLLFAADLFIIHEPLDTFIANNVSRDLRESCQVKFGKRFAGKSNYSLWKKTKLFFIYSSYFVRHPFRKIAFGGVMFFAIGGAYFFLFAAGYHSLLFQFEVLLSLLSIMMVNLYFLLSVLIKPPPGRLYSITESLNRRVL